MKQQRVVVITGGLRGIGRAIVDQFYQSKDMIWVFDKAPCDEPLVAQLPPEVRYRSVNVAQHDVVAATMQEIYTQTGRIDVLVNNAGITHDGLAIRLKPDEWERVLQVNMNGSFWCAQAVLGIMARQRSGVIINVSSVVASIGNPGQVNYAASKAGVEAMTKTLAREYGARGIRVNAVAPGFIATPMTAKLSEKNQEAAISRTSLKRAGKPEEVAQVVAFLASPAADYITGQIIHINGGMW